MGLSNGAAPPQRGNAEGEPELARLLEAAEWLGTAGLAPPSASAQPVVRLQALVVHLRVRSLLEPESLRGFSDRFPDVAILVHRRGTNDAEQQNLASVIAAFSSSRRLSPRQRLILELYLNGQNDKEIAISLGCELATVYEHWRRMGRKSEGKGKGDVVADFHRCLACNVQVTSEDE